MKNYLLILSLFLLSCEKEKDVPVIEEQKTEWTLSINIPSENVAYSNLTAVKVGILEDGHNNVIGDAIRFEKDGFIVLFYRLFDGTVQQINGALNGHAFGLVAPKTTLGFCGGGQDVQFSYTLNKK